MEQSNACAGADREKPTINDGDAPSGSDISNKMITVAVGRFKADKFWHNWTGTVDQFVDRCFARHRPGAKDGESITQGELVDLQRISKNVRANYIVMFDHDNGDTLGEIEAKISGLGLAAILSTTYNHNKAETEIDQDALLKFIENQNLDRNDLKGAAHRYLSIKKKMVERVLETISDVREEHRPGGVKVVVSHAPMHRARSVLILEEPYYFSGTGSSQKERIEEWKGRYLGLAEKLGLGVDDKCIDPSLRN